MPLFGTDGNGFFLTKRSFVIFFTFLSYIIEYLIIILRNCWIHYNAYKRTEMPSFMTLLHFRTCHNFWNLETSAKFQNLIFFIDFSSNAGSSKIVHLSNSDIAWHSRYLRLHGVCITDRRSPIACQTRRSFSTILLEYLHGCLSPLAWALQYLHCPWIHLSTWIEFRSHSPVFGRASGCASGCGSLAENVQFYFTPGFPFLKDLSLYDASLRHWWNIAFLKISSTVLLECLLEWFATQVSTLPASLATRWLGSAWDISGVRKAK